MTGEPWPHIRTDGKLEEAAEREWLHTNGTGAYAMSTVALMHTRRYHGLLVAALEPPVQRYVIVSHADTVVSVGRRDFRLATHQFPDVAPTHGYRLLESFAQDPLPRWTYLLGGVRLERRLCLARGRNATVLSYTWHGRHAVRLQMKPLFAMRPMHTVAREHGGMIQRVSLRQGEVEIQPLPDLPPVVFGHNGVFMGSPDWWRRFEYSVDRRRGVSHIEDLWTPGMFELRLEPGVPNYVIFGLDGLPSETAADSMQHVSQALMRLDPGPTHSAVCRQLSIAAEQFRADEGPRPGVIAGYPWLDFGARDALIGLSGLYLVDGRVEAAKRVVGSLLAARRGGLLPRGISENGPPSEAVSADTSLWLFEVAHQMLAHVEPSDPFLQHSLYPALKQVQQIVHGGQSDVLWLCEDGLLGNGGGGAQQPLTWMDSRAEGSAVTPRSGFAVELQGLWSRACQVLVRLASKYGEVEVAQRAQLAGLALDRAFRARFWCDRTRYAYDCIAADASRQPAAADPSIRPNAVIALSVAPNLFEPWQAAEILSTVRERLLTPVGLRTLAPGEPGYRGDFRGVMEQRRIAYHQGTAWLVLLGFFARAAFRLDPNDFELQIELRHLVEQIVGSGPVLGQVAQVASGEPPHDLGGCPAQAWSVAELLRMLKEQLES